jgi:hypothetical protein
MCGQPNFNASHIYYTNITDFNRLTIHKHPMLKKLSEPKKSEKKSQINSQKLIYISQFIHHPYNIKI